MIRFFLYKCLAVAYLFATAGSLQAQNCCHARHFLTSTESMHAQGELAAIEMKKGELILQLPMKFIGREFLISSCVSRTTHNRWLSVGTRGKAIHARLDYTGAKMYLRKINSDVVGNPSDTLTAQSIQDSFMDAYLMELPIKSISSDKQTVTLDITDLFSSNGLPAYLPINLNRSQIGRSHDLCQILGVKVFDDNMCINLLHSFRNNSTDEICSAEIAYSFLLLPEEKMRPRITDSRVGLFTQQKKQLDLGQCDFYKSIAYVQRWRVEPSNWQAWEKGKLVTPKKQIVYYIDNAFPESWKEPLRKGILEWNKAFEAIGLKDVVAVKDYPIDDPKFDEDNLKYNCIRYITTNRGAAQGPSWTDPSTGEILNASVYVWASLAEIMNSFCFVQTAQANPGIRNGKMSNEEMAAALQMIITHEIGHTLGLAHNMGGSAAYSVKSLLDPKFVEKNGLSSSVMDYLYYNYIVPPERTDIPLYSTKLGVCDKLCIKYAYMPTDPSLSIEEDQKTAELWLDEYAGIPEYKYGIQQWGNKYDPNSLINDISNDALEAGTLGITNLKYVLGHLNEWLAGGEKATQRKDMYQEIIKHYKDMVKSALYNVGGISLSFVKDGTKGNTYQSIDRNRQKEAMKWVANEIRHSDWLNDQEVLSTFEPSLGGAVEVQAEIAEEIISAGENVVLSAYLSQQPYTLKDYTDDIYELYFDEPSKSKTLSVSDKVLQRSLVQAMLECIHLKKAQEDSFLAETTDKDAMSTAFGLRADGGYLYHVNIDKICEQRAYFFLLLEKIDNLAQSHISSGSDEYLAHWIMIHQTIKNVLD